MAGFQTHITVSSLLGIGVAWVGHGHYQLDWGTCAVGGVLCSIGGMMPDLDSDTGIPARETLNLAAAVAPMLLFKRLHYIGIDVEHMILFGAPLYLLIRFGFGWIFRKFTVHRGMFHSIPAMIIAYLITYLLCDEGVTTARIFKASGMTMGFFSHLLLDEIWSVKVGATGPRLKSSFGTAIKFFGTQGGANSFCYAALILLSLTAFQESAIENAPMTVQTMQRLRLGHRNRVPPPLSIPMSEAEMLNKLGEEATATPPGRRPMYQARLRRFDADPQ